MPLPIVAAGLGSVISTVILTLARLYLVKIIGRVLLTVGVGLFAYTYAVPQLMTWISGKFNALPDFVRASVGACGIDVLITMVISAMAVKASTGFFFGRRES